MVYISSASTSAKRPTQLACTSFNQLPRCSREREQDKALEASEAGENWNFPVQPHNRSTCDGRECIKTRRTASKISNRPKVYSKRGVTSGDQNKSL